MEKFTTLQGVAAPLKIINVDTDMIIPKQYLKTIKRTGLGKGLFSEQRYNDDGSENPDFILNKPAYKNAKIIVADWLSSLKDCFQHARDHAIIEWRNCSGINVKSTTLRNSHLEGPVS